MLSASKERLTFKSLRQISNRLSIEGELES